MSHRADTVLDELEGLRALARSLVHGDAEADDLMQDTAEIALRHPPETDRSTRPWLATVLRNRRRMDRRADSRRRTRETADALTAERLATSSDELVDRARTLEKLSGALVALAEPFRTTVIRRYLDGESAVQISRALGVPAGTVRWRLKEGLERLRSALDDATPSWKRALIPFVGVPGAAVKTKSSIVIIIVVLALLAGVIGIVLVRRDDGTPDRTPTPKAHAAIEGMRLGDPMQRAAVPADASVMAVVDPLPGQGRATIVERTAPGGEATGRVINWSTGEGVANAELTFGAEAGAQTVRTNQAGAFTLTPPSPDRYKLIAVVAQGFLPYAPELLTTNVQLSLAKDRAVDGLTVFLFPALDYHGLVVDAKGAPVPGAKVRLLGTLASEQSIETLATEWTSDKDGRFIFHAADNAVLEASKGDERGWSALDGNVATTQRMTIQLRTQAARTGTIKGVVVDEDTKTPVPQIIVTGIPQNAPGGESPRAIAQATTGDDGSFTLTELDDGKYALATDGEGFAPYVLADIAAGSENVRMLIDRGKEISGTVANTQGEPVPAFTLLVFRPRGVSREMVLAKALVSSTGAFSVRVPAGPYELLASASGWAPSTTTAAKAGDTGVKLTVSAGATIRGLVIDSQTREPLSFARVMREAPGGGASAQPANAGTVTREDGTFELTGIPPGPASITIGGGGYHPKIEGGLLAVDGGVIGPVTIPLRKLAPGEKPTLELVGIGVKLHAEGDALIVDAVIEGSGAAAAGIVVGDQLISLDGAAVTQLGMEGAIARIRGTEGSTITVTIRRNGTPQPVVVTRKKLSA